MKSVSVQVGANPCQDVMLHLPMLRTHISHMPSSFIIVVNLSIIPDVSVSFGKHPSANSSITWFQLLNSITQSDVYCMYWNW
jgi:hypothetical protein